MAPKKKSHEAPSSLRRATKEQPKKQPPISYSSTQIRQRLTHFKERKIISSKFISRAILEKIGCYNEVRILLENVGMYNFPFNAYPTYPSLVHKFLVTYCLRTNHFDNQNPMNNMRFRLGGRDIFLTSQEFDNIFGFRLGV